MLIRHPYLLFLGDVPDQLSAKTAQGIVDWRRDWCLGQLRLPGCKADTGLPDKTIQQAADEGARTLIVGVVNAGGVLPDHWIGVIQEALAAGLDVASGLHVRLSSIPAIADTARECGRELFDVRHSDQRFAVGKGTKRSGMRLLTVGTDCSVGKKYAALALEKEMRARGFDADFKATGQTGVFISGRGVAIDAVVADFISGAVEWISPAADISHWDLIEGQGSLFHPSFAGVSLGLLHGAQADAFVVCHEPTRRTMRGVAHPLPTIREVIDMTVRLGALTNPGIRPIGISVNTQALDEKTATETLKRLQDEHFLPATDPIRFGVGPIVDRIAADFPLTRGAVKVS
ncbi:N-acetyltransferase DgcN [Rhodomicrobium sp.]|uniref:N-acetyltransferase DgcN n=1 Tax=Rhodomicrobium sp. TaxID=2720632 RepID=UPI0039E36AAF